LYAKAQQYVESQKKDKDRSKHSKSSSNKRHRRRSRSEISESSSDGKHSRRKEYKHSKKRSKHSHRDRDDKDKKHKKKHTESGKSSSKKSKHTSSFKDKATKIDTSKLVFLGDITNEFPPKLDAETGYFSHNSHLRLYLYRKYGIYFEDLDSSESHDAFKEFTTLYNTGKLEKAYYNELLPQDALDQCSRTKHKWAFKTNRTEEQSLSMVKAGVKKQTEYSSDKKLPPVANMATATVAKGRGVSIGPARPNQDEQQQQAAAQRAAQRQSDIQHRNRIKLANEDMYGKSDPGSRERQMEKKREMSAKVHGASRDKESEAFGELDDDAIYGNGGISGGRGRGRKGEATYEQALAREKAYKERKESEKAARHSELLQKESDKQKQMMEMLGLGNLVKKGEKIKIAPRGPE